MKKLNIDFLDENNKRNTFLANESVGSVSDDIELIDISKDNDIKSVKEDKIDFIEDLDFNEEDEKIYLQFKIAYCNNEKYKSVFKVVSQIIHATLLYVNNSQDYILNKQSAVINFLTRFCQENFDSTVFTYRRLYYAASVKIRDYNNAPILKEYLDELNDISRNYELNSNTISLIISFETLFVKPDNIDEYVSKTLSEQSNILNNIDKGNIVKQFLREYSPKKIKEYLDKYIVGQEEAKKNVSLVFYEHVYKMEHPESKIKKKNLLLIGPSGCGKTEILRVLKKISPVPIVIFDSAGLTQDGWKGEKKVSTIIDTLVQEAYTFRNQKYKSNDSKLYIKLIENGIICLDEFDKVVQPNYNSNGQNVSISMQGEMLKFFEDGDMHVGRTIISSQNILVICAGAFSSLHEENNKIDIGFNSDMSDETEVACTQKDLIEFGITPELMGRISLVSNLNKLTQENMLSILKLEDGILSRFEEELKTFDIKVNITDDALKELTDKALDEVGVRGVQAVLDKLAVDIVYSETKGDVEVTGAETWGTKEMENG